MHICVKLKRIANLCPRYTFITIPLHDLMTLHLLRTKFPRCALLWLALTVPVHSQLHAEIPATSVQVAFSPEAGAETLVLQAIESARSSIRLAAYSFTSPRVVKALLDAKRRGVDVAIVVDYKSNIAEDRSGKAKAALNLLVNAGIPTRTISAYAIHHDKYAVADASTVQTGSFNYSDAAARRNSENVIVIWNNPAIARQYLAHWTSRWNQGDAYKSTY